MKEKNTINIGDLIRLQDLEKPGDGMVKLGLSENPTTVTKLEDKMSGFASAVEDNTNVQTSTVVDLARALKEALKRELSPEQTKIILAKLKDRFENKTTKKKRHPGLEWSKIQERLEANSEKLWSLNEMERTKGEPDVLGQDDKTGECIFMDCSTESPEGRRNCVYDRAGEKELKEQFPNETCNGNAVSMAALMGITLLSEAQYRDLQTKGEFDKNSRSWLQTPLDKRSSGDALSGARAGDGVGVDDHYASDHGDDRAFRGWLSV